MKLGFLSFLMLITLNAYAKDLSWEALNFLKEKAPVLVEVFKDGHESLSTAKQFAIITYREKAESPLQTKVTLVSTGLDSSDPESKAVETPAGVFSFEAWPFVDNKKDELTGKLTVNNSFMVVFRKNPKGGRNILWFSGEKQILGSRSTSGGVALPQDIAKIVHDVSLQSRDQQSLLVVYSSEENRALTEAEESLVKKLL